MVTHGPGTKHNALTGGTYVYTKPQCDDELDKKQDKLVAGDGVTISDGVISCVLSTAVSNRCRVLDINSLSTTESNLITVDNNYHIYFATVSSDSVMQPFVIDGLAESAGPDMYSIEVWVKVFDPAFELSFECTDGPTKCVGDTDYRVHESGQTLRFVVQYYKGEMLVNKYYCG